jgi:hypothetical protein
MDATQKNQVIERLRQAQNVLIAVSSNPSVDQLASAIGLALMLNKLNKHTTAVFSGAVPSTIEFLQPEATLEQNTDSLRDFIISLDKAKADKLRYKVEEDVVKIFITPYRTSLSQADFNFEEGDYNVDVVIALGVDQQEHIDQAITAHGRILHDSTVIGVAAGEGTTDVGSINWIDTTASSLCEMIVSISEAFQSGILDGQMATAFLTGIVANTNRFSNEKTTPKVMTMAAQLMAAGANQQLISNALIPTPPPLPLSSPTEEPAPLPIEAVQLNPTSPVATSTLPDAVSTPKESTPHPPTEPEVQEVTPMAILPPAPNDDNIPRPPNEIKIDEQGTLYHVGDLAEVVSNAPTPARNAIINKGPNVTPPPEEPTTYGSYMTSPPQINSTMTANAGSGGLEPSIDPLSAPSESSTSTLAKTDSVQPTSESDTPTSATNEGQVSSSSSSDSLVASASTDTDGRKMVEESMAKLKESVEAGKPALTDQAAGIVSNEEAARKAVTEAVQSAPYDENHSQKDTDLSTMPLGNGLHPEAESSTITNNHTPNSYLEIGTQEASDEPPAVPPPLPMAPTVDEKPVASPSSPPKNGSNFSAPDMPLPPNS